MGEVEDIKRKSAVLHKWCSCVIVELRQYEHRQDKVVRTITEMLDWFVVNLQNGTYFLGDHLTYRKLWDHCADRMDFYRNRILAFSVIKEVVMFATDKKENELLMAGEMALSLQPPGMLLRTMVVQWPPDEHEVFLNDEFVRNFRSNHKDGPLLFVHLHNEAFVPPDVIDIATLHRMAENISLRSDTYVTALKYMIELEAYFREDRPFVEKVRDASEKFNCIAGLLASVIPLFLPSPYLATAFLATVTTMHAKLLPPTEAAEFRGSISSLQSQPNGWKSSSPSSASHSRQHSRIPSNAFASAACPEDSISLEILGKLKLELERAISLQLKFEPCLQPYLAFQALPDVLERRAAYFRSPPSSLFVEKPSPAPEKTYDMFSEAVDEDKDAPFLQDFSPAGLDTLPGSAVVAVIRSAWLQMDSNPNNLHLRAESQEVEISSLEMAHLMTSIDPGMVVITKQAVIWSPADRIIKKSKKKHKDGVKVEAFAENTHIYEGNVRRTHSRLWASSRSAGGTDHPGEQRGGSAGLSSVSSVDNSKGLFAGTSKATGIASQKASSTSGLNELMRTASLQLNANASDEDEGNKKKMKSRSQSGTSFLRNASTTKASEHGEMGDQGKKNRTMEHRQSGSGLLGGGLSHPDKPKRVIQSRVRSKDVQGGLVKRGGAPPPPPPLADPPPPSLILTNPRRPPAAEMDGDAAPIVVSPRLNILTQGGSTTGLQNGIERTDTMSSNSSGSSDKPPMFGRINSMESSSPPFSRTTTNQSTRHNRLHSNFNGQTMLSRMDTLTNMGGTYSAAGDDDSDARHATAFFNIESGKARLGDVEVLQNSNDNLVLWMGRITGFTVDFMPLTKKNVNNKKENSTADSKYDRLDTHSRTHQRSKSRRQSRGRSGEHSIDIDDPETSTTKSQYESDRSQSNKKSSDTETEAGRVYFVTILYDGQSFQFYPLKKSTAHQISIALTTLTGLLPYDVKTHVLDRNQAETQKLQARILQDILDDPVLNIKNGRLKSPWITHTLPLTEMVNKLTVNPGPQQLVDVEILFHSCRLNHIVTKETLTIFQNIWKSDKSETVRLKILLLLHRLIDRSVFNANQRNYRSLLLWLSHIDTTLDPYKSSRSVKLLSRLRKDMQSIKATQVSSLSLFDVANTFDMLPDLKAYQERFVFSTNKY